jgi:tetratricopeptide (TPR) repeat protein
MRVWNYRTTILMGLFVCWGSVLLAEEALPESKSDSDHPPTLKEIAQANDAAWAAIKSVDMEYEMSSYLVEKGEKGNELKSTNIRWCKEGNRERVIGFFHTANCNNGRIGDWEPEQRIVLEDIYLDGTTRRELRDSDPFNKNLGEFSYSNQKEIVAYLSPQGPNFFEKWGHSPQTLQHLRFTTTGNEDFFTLAEIIEKCEVTLKGKKLSQSGDLLWLLHAEYPAKNADDERAGSYMDIAVNANKNYLIQSVLFYEINAATNQTGMQVGIYCGAEVKEFQDCGEGVYFPKVLEYRLMGTVPYDHLEIEKQIALEDGFFTTFTGTQLSVNRPMPPDAFDFRFPNNAVVKQMYDSGNKKPGRIFLWGPENKPIKQFENREEFVRFMETEHFEKVGKRIEENRNSDNQWDLIERGQFFAEKKEHDKAIEALSKAISIDPKSEEAADALMTRGIIYFLGKKDYAKSIDDMTECLKWLKLNKKDEAEGADELAMLYFFRGLSYIHQENTFDQALADMTDAIRNDPSFYEGAIGSHLIRSAIYLQKGELEKALADANEAVKIDPQCADALLVRSRIYEKQDDQEKAASDRQAYRQIEKKTPVNEGLAEQMQAALHDGLARLVTESEKR